LPLEYYVASYGDFKARTEFERDIREEGTLGNSFRIDGRE